VSLAGEPVVVTLYWQALAPTDQDYVSSVHLLGPELASLGQVDRYPGSGLVPTSRWQPGQIWRDSYHVYPDTATASPLRLRISADLYDATTDASLDASGPDGQPMAVVIVGDAWLDAFRPAPMEPAHLLTVPFADGIEFVGYDQAPQPARPGDTLDATLYWRATGTPGLDYTVFVHLLDGQGNQVAGGDAQPVAANSPTSGWRAGDEIADPHAVLLPPDLSPGTYRLAVGLYDPASGARLPRLDGSGDSVSWDVKVESP
jgi:hypothetical protein